MVGEPKLITNTISSQHIFTFIVPSQPTFKRDSSSLGLQLRLIMAAEMPLHATQVLAIASHVRALRWHLRELPLTGMR